MKRKKFLKTSVIILLGVVAAGAQTFPPVPVTGPFPKGTEAKRGDAPVDSLRTASPMIYHEYTCYKVKNPPVVDGNVETDSIWAKIPWTPMTFWESQTTERTITVFSGDSTDTWTGPKDCTAWFKLLWDESNVYVAVKVYDDIFNPITDTSDLTTTDSKIYQHDCIQLSFNTTPPDTHVDSPVDPYLQCELGAAIATAYPPDTLKDSLDTTQLIIAPDTTKVPDTSEAFTFWQNGNSNSGMSLSPGDNTRGNGSSKNKAIHASVEKTADYCITRYEFALRRTDTTSGFLWSPYIRDDHVGRFSIMAMDHDSKAVDTLEAVSWASGILTKNFNMFGSIKWSSMTPDGEAFPTGTGKTLRSVPSMFGLPHLSQSSAWIEYSVIRSGRVSLDLYDYAGRKVFPLVDRELSPGSYRVALPTAGIARGAYFYRLKMKDDEAIRRLTVIK